MTGGALIGRFTAARPRGTTVARALAIGCAMLGIALLYLLSRASANTELFSQHYPWLLGVGLMLACGLFALTGYELWELRRKLKARVFGSRLTLRLTIVFVLMALVPGALVYAVSVQFLARSIESWFDVSVDSGLGAGVNLGRGALINSLKELGEKADAMALALSDRTMRADAAQLNRLRELYAVEEATLLDGQRNVLAYASALPRQLMPDLPTADVLRQVRAQQRYQEIESIPGRGLYLRVVVPISGLALTSEVHALQLLQPVPRQIAQDAEQVQAGYRDYQQLTLSRLGLKRIFGLALTLALLLSLLSAIALAFVISERFSAPLGLLAESTRAISRGDFSKLNPVSSSDEFGVLTRSFNLMTRRLKEASETVERKQLLLESAKAYVESLLSNLTAGVLAFDEQMCLRTLNASAAEILGIAKEVVQDTELRHWGGKSAELRPFAERILAEFRSVAHKPWEAQIEYHGQRTTRMLQVKGTRLPDESERGFLVVFDDITHLIQAQREAAWGEVARRLAHEIKNPLTPIQLSAERLQSRLAHKLPESDAMLLTRSTGTIINQVAALKRMVNDFSEYARAAKMAPVRVCLNDLVRDVATLYEATEPARLSLELEPNLPEIWGDPTLLRQVLNNLVQNAIDALCGASEPRIVVRTERRVDGVLLVVCDNGSGFSEAILTRAFEPYVTTKPKGTGLGLAIVKRIVDEHEGRIQVNNVAPHGASVSITLPLAA